MKKLIILISLLFVSVSVSAQETDSVSQETTLIFVRHAEKADDGSDNPSLNEKGKERAIRLADLMANKYQISAVYSTRYNRTLETASPIADRLGISIQEYDLKDPIRLLEQLIETYQGQEVLIVGHSNTTPMLVNAALGTGLYEKLNEDTYNVIFIVHANSVGRACADKITY